MAELWRAEALEIPADLDYSALQFSNEEIVFQITLDPAESFMHGDASTWGYSRK